MDNTKLKEILDYHNTLYYTMDAPEILDEEYDEIKKKYIELEGEYNFVPGSISSNLDSVAHSYPVKSLDKVNTLEETRAEIRRLLPVVIQPKIDGLTVVGYPGTITNSGMFVTRGNGLVGEKITNTAIKIEGINKVSKDNDAPIRMEAYMPISVFNTLNAAKIAKGEEPFKNPRNAAAGMLRHKNADKVEGIYYWAYNIMGSTKSESEQLEELRRYNFITIPSWRFTNVDEALDFITKFNRKTLDYEIDGLVIKSDLPDSLAIFGETGHHPKNATAYKFAAEGKWTTIKYIEWKIGKTGRITPVATLNPIDLEGSTISRVTLHNKSIMDTLGITEVCEVFVIKAQGIIPAIIKVRNISGPSIIEPTYCPSCGIKTERINDQIFCNNINCKEKMVRRISHIGSRDALDIEGLSDETALKIVEAIDPKSAFDIFNLTVEDIIKLPGFAKKSADNLYKAIQGARNIDLKRFLYAAGIPMVGRSATEDIANVFGSYPDILEDMRNGYTKMKAIEGIGPILIDNMKEYGFLWVELKKYVTPINKEKISTPDKVLTFVITGTLEKPRSYYENMIKKVGHKISGSLSKVTNYLLAGQEAGSKLSKAIELGFDKEGRILYSEEELIKVLKQ